jgi:hypothetical protein
VLFYADCNLSNTNLHLVLDDVDDEIKSEEHESDKNVPPKIAKGLLDIDHVIEPGVISLFFLDAHINTF